MGITDFIGGLFGTPGHEATSMLGGGAQTVAAGAAGTLGGLGLAEGIFDWGDVFFGGNTPRPVHGPGEPSVHLNERAAQLPGGGVMDELGFRHWWLQTPDREAGMGPATGGVPGERFELPGMTTINDHTGEAARPDVISNGVPGVDPARVDELLTNGRETGPWIPFINDCNQAMDDVLEDAGADPRDYHAPSPLHSRALHDVVSGRASDAQTDTTLGLAGAGAATGILAPAMAPWLLGAGAVSYLSGTTAEYLEANDQTSAAEGVSILGMGGTGAMLGAGIGSMIAPGAGTAIGAGIGGGAGLVAGSVMSLLGDENPESPRVEVPGLGTSVSAEEGVGIAGMAAGGAVLGATIGSIVPVLGTGIGALAGAGIGALAGGIMSLWD